VLLRAPKLGFGAWPADRKNEIGSSARHAGQSQRPDKAAQLSATEQEGSKEDFLLLVRGRVRSSASIRLPLPRIVRIIPLASVALVYGFSSEAFRKPTRARCSPPPKPSARPKSQCSREISLRATRLLTD
jgi:hypothetical protein